MLERYTEAVARRRWALLIAVGAVVGLAATGFAKLEFDTTYRIWFEEDSPHLAEYDELLANFGSDDSALIVLTNDEPLFENDVLGSIQTLAADLWKIDGVKRVDSLANFSVVRGSRIEHESAALVATDGFVAAAGDQGDIHLFGADGQRRLVGHTGTVEHLVGDETTLYSAGLDRTVRAWDVSSGRMRFVARETVDTISALLRHEDRLYVGTRGAVVALDAESGRRVATFAAGDDFVTAIVVDDDRLMVVARDTFSFDEQSGAELGRARHSRPALAVVYDAGRHILFTAHDDGTVVAHERETSKTTYRAPSRVISAALAGSDLLLGLADGSLHTVGADGNAQVEPRHADWITDILVDGDRIITASRDRDVLVDGDRLAVHRAPVRRVAVHGDRLLTLGDDGDLYTFDRSTLAMTARHRRARAQRIGAVVPLEGSERATLEIANAFRTPVEVIVGGRSLGVVAPDQIGRFEGLPLAPETSCGSDGCGAGRYCDYERDVPTCTTVASVTLLHASGTELTRTEAFLSPGGESRIEIPSDDAFSVTEALAAPVDTRATKVGFATAFPSAKPTLDRIVSADDAFLAPDIARTLRTALEGDGASREAVEHAATLAQAKLSPFSLPLQPMRLAELSHLLTKPPGRAAFRGMLNPALDTTLLVVAVHQPSDVGALDRAKRVTRDLRDVVAEAKKTSSLGMHLTGGIVQVTTMGEYAEREVDRLLPLFFAMLAVMLIVVYRRWAGLLVPLGLVVSSIVFSMGLAGHLGASLNNVTVVGPQVVLAACIGDAVHLFNAYSDRLRAGDSVLAATKYSVSENFMPCLWTSISTSLGFFSLCTSTVVPVATFGWISGIGVLTAFVLSFTLMPALLAALPRPEALKQKAAWLVGVDRLVDRALDALARGVNRNTAVILGVGAVLIAVAGLGLSDLKFEASELGAFEEGAPIRVATEMLEDRELSGSYGLHLMVDTGEEKGVRRVEHLERLAKLQEHLAGMPEVMSVVGVVDIQRRMNRVMNQDRPEFHRLPDTDREASAHYDAYTFSLESGRNMTHRVSAEEGATVVDVRLKSQKSTWLLAWGEDLRAWTAANVPELDVTITGKSWLVTNTVTEIAIGFIKNVGSAVLVISLLVLFAAGSFRIGLPGCVANVLPIGATLGFISLTGDAMDVSAIVSCCVSMGIVVDDTLHFMARYKARLQEGASHEEAIGAAIRSAGKAMLFTTTILVVGFMIFTLADYAVTVKIGLMASSMLFLGLALDLTLLPALLRIAQPRTATDEQPAVTHAAETVP